MASWVILVGALSVLYGLEARRVFAAGLGRQRWRALALRCLFYLIVGSVPARPVDPPYHWLLRLAPEDLGALLWLRRLVFACMYAGMDVLLVCYPPSAMDLSEPDGLVRCWRRTRPHRRMLLLLFFAMEGTFVLVNFGLVEIISRNVNLFPLAEWLSTWSHLPDTYFVRLLPVVAGYAVATVGSNLFFGAISFAFYRHAKDAAVGMSVFD